MDVQGAINKLLARERPLDGRDDICHENYHDR